ncbi:MAG TPA: SsrA-binding protein SmpB [Candidatus Spyradosoma merdigallinarum]|uniref:SsrA-binding protein n=1 Tax=Candidatus Spyradosoma merdigallinarum TaxID=2840950 RepID=A0A9D1NJH8_9BACT|nr:SsrA-binding protein SmpB [Candidatus Spyradosoma merdigallinarum]
MSKKKDNARLAEIRNPKASRDYFLGTRFEAGVALTGTEVKAVRLGRANIADAFVRIDNGSVPILYHAHISEYDFGNTNNHQPYRPRKLLLHAREIRKIVEEIRSGGKTVVPTRLYFRHGLVKAEIAIAQGKKLHDKRNDIKKRDDERYVRRALRSRG